MAGDKTANAGTTEGFAEFLTRKGFNLYKSGTMENQGDVDTYEGDDEILAQMNAAKAELEGVSEVSREMVNKIFQDPLIQRHFLRRIAEDFITSSDFQSDDESAFKY